MCTVHSQVDDEITDADRVQAMFASAFKDRVWAGGVVPNVMGGLQRAVLNGADAGVHGDQVRKVNNSKILAVTTLLG